MKQTSAFTRYSKIFYVDNKVQLLKLKISGGNRYLIKDEIPISVVWRGDHQSSFFYAYLASLNSKIIESADLEKMNLKLHYKIERTDSLKNVISPLLSIVENGWYQIFYHEPLPITLDFSSGMEPAKCIGVNDFTFYTDYNFDKNKSSAWIDDTIIFTQDIQTLNRERVDFYKESIRDGKRPSIITMGATSFRFKDIDGLKKAYLMKIKERFLLWKDHHKVLTPNLLLMVITKQWHIWNWKKKLV